MKKYISLLILLISFSFFLDACTKSSEKPSEPKQNGNVATPIPQKPVQPKPVIPKAKPSPPTPVLKPGDFFPLTQGASWEYQGEGNEYAAFNRKVVYSNGDLAQIREDNGGTVSAAVFKVTPEAITRIFFQGEAYEQTNFLTSEPNESLIILKLPLEVGTQWTTTIDLREIVDTNASVNTPVGNFTKCIKVKITSQNSTVFEYFKKGVGMVLREFVSGDTKVTSTLKKYNKGL